MKFYFACLKFKDGHIEIKRFDDRDEARDYIKKEFNPDIHIQCWTE